jgi:hypothetical protein
MLMLDHLCISMFDHVGIHRALASLAPVFICPVRLLRASYTVLGIQVNMLSFWRMQRRGALSNALSVSKKRRQVYTSCMEWLQFDFFLLDRGDECSHGL